MFRPRAASGIECVMRCLAGLGPSTLPLPAYCIVFEQSCRHRKSGAAMRRFSLPPSADPCADVVHMCFIHVRLDYLCLLSCCRRLPRNTALPQPKLEEPLTTVVLFLRTPRLCLTYVPSSNRTADRREHRHPLIIFSVCLGGTYTLYVTFSAVHDTQDHKMKGSVQYR